MTVEEIQEVYGRLVSERDDLRKRYAAAASELRRIGEVLKVMGGDLAHHPETIRPEPTFDQDMAGLRRLLDEYMELSAAIEAKNQEIATFFVVR